MGKPAGSVQTQRARVSEHRSDLGGLAKEAAVRQKADEEAAASRVKTGEKLKGELDDLLDEIDEVLETNAEEFVKSYVQKGGQ